MILDDLNAAPESCRWVKKELHRPGTNRPLKAAGEGRVVASRGIAAGEDVGAMYAHEFIDVPAPVASAVRKAGAAASIDTALPACGLRSRGAVLSLGGDLAAVGASCGGGASLKRPEWVSSATWDPVVLRQPMEFCAAAVATHGIEAGEAVVGGRCSD